MVLLDFAFTERVRELNPGTTFGLLLARDVDQQRLAAHLQPIRKETQRGLAGSPAANVAESLEAFDAYFGDNGFESPLRAQRERFRKSGIPSANSFLTLLLLGELRTGVLVGIQDANAIQPPLRFDVAGDGESFAGMRDVIRCRAGEPVLRDSQGIVASLFQGPDKRTRLESGSRDVAVFVFSAPKRRPFVTEATVEEIRSMLEPACGALERAIFSSEAMR